MPGQMFPGDPGFGGQPTFPGQAGFGGQPNFPGQLGFGGQPGFSRRAWRPGYAGPDLPAVRAGRWVVLALMAVFIAMIIGAFVAVTHANSIFGRSGPGSGSCVGGPVTGSTGQSLGNGDVRFPCSGGGSVVVHLGN